MEAFEIYIKEQFPARKGFLQEISQLMMISGGKRLRPALVILSSMLGNYERQKAFAVAAAIETLHTATLVHDDIIDRAGARRGKESVYARHGVNLAVYSGDYLLVKAVKMLSEADIPTERLKDAAHAIELICLGEVDQFLGRKRIPSFREYLRRIVRKTGILFAASCSLGALSAGRSEEEARLLARFGMYFGIAFQIRDDLIDLETVKANEGDAGKPTKHDLKEGIVTLPVVLAARHNVALRWQLNEYFSEGGDVTRIVMDILSAGGAKDARKIKQRYIEKGHRILGRFPDTESRRALAEALAWVS